MYKAEQIFNKMGTVHKYHAGTAGKSSEMKMYTDKIKMYEDKIKKYKYKMKMYEDTDKTAGILSSVGKLLSKTLTKVKPVVAKSAQKAKSMGKDYGRHVKSDFATAKRLTVDSKGKLIKNLGYHDRIQRNKAFVGLAARVVLPGYIAGDMLT